MADRHSRTWQDGAPVGACALKVASVFALAVSLYYTGTSDISSSSEGELSATPPSATRSASLDLAGDRPAVVGSVSHLFDNEMFVGFDRSEKISRPAQKIDVAAFANDFAPLWTQVAAQRMPVDTGLAQHATTAVAEADPVSEPVQVAAVDPAAISSDGLRAIDRFSSGTRTDAAVPSPASVPDSLAYARANTPATDFTPTHDYSERELWCLSTGIYFEARGESYRGQVAVAQVIMNRVEDDRYPNSICGVVYQNQSRRNACQFSFACDGQPERINEQSSWTLAEEVTQEVINEEIYLTEVADSTHYHATYVSPRWARKMDRLTQIGLHVFYRFKPGWRFG